MFSTENSLVLQSQLKQDFSYIQRFPGLQMYTFSQSRTNSISPLLISFFFTPSSLRPEAFQVGFP